MGTILLEASIGRDLGALKGLSPFRAPEPLLILNPCNFVPKNGFPVVKKGVNPKIVVISSLKKNIYIFFRFYS